jgi:maltoporin
LGKIQLTSTERHDVGSPPPISDTGNGFSFGSYGRVNLGIDGNGHEGYPVNVVSHGSRLEEPTYLELDLYYGGQIVDGGPRWRAVIAPAFGGDLFHYTGDFSTHFALRNAYLEATDFGTPGLRAWVGSRMYRGDDVYLFDYWPVDNLNTVGAGVGWGRYGWDVALHGGLNRLNDPFQYETLPTPARGLGPPGQALILDRPRAIISLKATRYFGAPSAQRGAKVSLYSELHILPNGTEQFPTENLTQKLPSDYGWVAGTQVGGWLRPYTFANLFLRVAGGLAAYGELTPPAAVGADRRTTDAREVVVALSANYEASRFGVMFGGYFRSFTDAAPGPDNPASYVEGIVAARPALYVTKWFHIAAELSEQARQYGGFDQLAGRRLTPNVFRASVMPTISPMGKGTYARPAIFLVATVSRLNDDARLALFDPTDVRYGASTVLYLGAGAEWWFQSSYR